MATRITATKLDHAVKVLRGVLACDDADVHLDRGPIEEAIRELLQARVELWNRPGAR